ncbi:RsmB/NOP family class I SAM-dependent RNA methyltransferase [Candidatus Bathyarchaeota archaeon]|nr:RsmB/NOP family class I SAM-dependent RNA methyltransferase [Candidatus Bathyarchaeota archaeon]
MKQVYGDEVMEVVQSLKIPSRRQFLRVNTLKITPEGLVNAFLSQGIELHRFDQICEAVFTHVEGPLAVPVAQKRIVVDKFTAESVLQGAHVYAPGVLKCSRLKRGDYVTVTDVHSQVVGAGVMRMSETEILTLRRGLAVEVTSPMYRALSLRETEEYEQGLFYPQSLPAIVTSRILAPSPGETIIDMNCSPGGKLSHISQLMQNAGRVVGVDRNMKKIEIARRNIQRLGCTNVTLISHDARYLDVDYPSLRADKCLVDPPCSALGLSPKLYVDLSESSIKNLADYQKQFLNAASRITKSGGRIVYSVCTITEQECEEVARFGVEELGLEIAEQKPYLGVVGLKSFGAEASLLQRFDPRKHGIGYFIAHFRKR